MYKFVYGDLDLIPENYRADCERIAEILWDRLSGYRGVSLVGSYRMWQNYSDSMCAGWMRLPEDDETIFNILVTTEDDDFEEDYDRDW